MIRDKLHYVLGFFGFTLIMGIVYITISAITYPTFNYLGLIGSIVLLVSGLLTALFSARLRHPHHQPTLLGKLSFRLVEYGSLVAIVGFATSFIFIWLIIS